MKRKAQTDVHACQSNTTTTCTTKLKHSWFYLEPMAVLIPGWKKSLSLKVSTTIRTKEHRVHARILKFIGCFGLTWISSCVFLSASGDGECAGDRGKSHLLLLQSHSWTLQCLGFCFFVFSDIFKHFQCEVLLEKLNSQIQVSACIHSYTDIHKHTIKHLHLFTAHVPLILTSL